MDDKINNPPHYTRHPSGIECIQVTEHFNFNLGNAIKYIWRCGLKGDELEDLKKARWYIDREIRKREEEVDQVIERIRRGLEQSRRGEITELDLETLLPEDEVIALDDQRPELCPGCGLILSASCLDCGVCKSCHISHPPSHEFK